MKRKPLQGMGQALLAIAALLGSDAAVHAQSELEGAVREPIGPLDRVKETQLAITAGAGWSDNIALESVNAQEGTIGQVGLLVGFASESPKLSSDVEANVAFEHYFDGTFDDDVIGGVDATLAFAVVPERFVWFLQENFGQITSDPFSAATPNNRENINFLTTGPDIMIRLGGVTSLLFSGRYSDTQYETSDLDGERFGGTLALARKVSAASTLSINLMGERVEFESIVPEGEVRNYDRQEAFARYDVHGARGSVIVDLGYTSIERDDESSHGLLARVALFRQITASSIVRLDAGTQFSSAGDMFRDLQSQRGVRLDSQSVIASNDPFESRFAAIGLNYLRHRTGFGLSGSVRDETYERSTALNRTLTSLEAYASRQLSRTTELRIFGTFDREDFDAGFTDDELRTGVALAWELGRHVELRLQYDRFDRDSSAGNTSYTENRGSIFATWSPMARK